jgi:hypothetical protein
MNENANGPKVSAFLMHSVSRKLYWARASSGVMAGHHNGAGLQGAREADKQRSLLNAYLVIAGGVEFIV